MWTALKLLLGKISPEDWLILGIVIAGAYIWLRISYLEHANDKLHADVITAQASLTTALGANKTNQTTITDLMTANTTWKTLADSRAAAFDAAAARVRSVESDNRKLLGSLVAQRAEIFKEPGCAQLAALDLSTCPDLARSLRDSARRNFDPLRSSINSNPGSDTPITH